MNDPAWCRARIDQLEDDVRQFTWSSGRFGEELEGIRTTWRDVAARDTFDRYLDPFRGEVAGTLQRLTEQLAQLRAVVAAMNESEKPAAEIQSFSEESARLREESANETDMVHHNVDQALDEASAAEALAAQATLTLASV